MGKKGMVRGYGVEMEHTEQSTMGRITENYAGDEQCWTGAWTQTTYNQRNNDMKDLEGKLSSTE